MQYKYFVFVLLYQMLSVLVCSEVNIKIHTEWEILLVITCNVHRVGHISLGDILELFDRKVAAPV
jgi:hypothetical protein